MLDTNSHLHHNTSTLTQTAQKIRGRVIELSHQAKAAHLGSCLSCIDLLVAVYFNYLKGSGLAPSAPERDRFILSKGHAAAALYAVLTERGYLTQNQLNSFGKPGSILEEHPNRSIPGVEAATGSLGHGLPIGAGMALAAKIQASPDQASHRVCVLMSDGECNEGSVWEAAMFAAAQQLNQLTVLIDFNKWQATGRSTEVLALQPLKEKWQAFGWQAEEIDGHDIDAIVAALHRPVANQPRVIIAHTVKGKGVSFMEDDNNWHYRIPSLEEVALAKIELGLSE